MIFYLFPYFYLLIFSFMDVFNNRTIRKYRKIVLWIVVIYLIFLAGYRYGMGTDYFTYLSLFRSINTFSDLTYLEPGFRLTISVLKAIAFSPQSLFFVFSLLTLVILGRAILKLSHYPILSLFLYFMIFYTAYVFNGMRQALAMSIYLLSISSILKKSLIEVVMLTIIASSFHNSGIIIFISYMVHLVNPKLDRKKYLAYTFLLIFIFFFSHELVGVLTRILPGFISNKLYSYIIKFEESVSITGIIQRLIILLPMILFLPYLKEVDNKFKYLFSVYFLGFALYCIFSFQGLFSTRINMFFRINEILLIPYFFKLNLKLFDKLLIYLVIILWGTIIFLSIAGNVQYVPYIHIYSQI